MRLVRREDTVIIHDKCEEYKYEGEGESNEGANQVSTFPFGCWVSAMIP